MNWIETRHGWQCAGCQLEWLVPTGHQCPGKKVILKWVDNEVGRECQRCQEFVDDDVSAREFEGHPCVLDMPLYIGHTPENLASQTNIKKMKMCPTTTEPFARGKNQTYSRTWPLFEFEKFEDLPAERQAEILQEKEAANIERKEVRVQNLKRRTCKKCEKIQKHRDYLIYGLCQECAFGEQLVEMWAGMKKHAFTADQPVRYLDLETTGLDRDSGIVQIAILDDEGNALLNSLVFPGVPIPQAATGVHRITDDMVINAPTILDLKPQIMEALEGCNLVIFNASFDTPILTHNLKVEQLPAAEIRCCMLRFSAFYGEWNNTHRDYKWKTLIFAADFLRHQWSHNPHHALADCEATRTIWHQLEATEKSDLRCCE